MKYFIDFEFIEGFKKPLFGKRRHFIDMISVGIYREDGKSYHCLSNEYDPRDASEWVKENVLIQMYKQGVHGDARNNWNAFTFHKYYGKSNEQIKIEILEFFGCYRDQLFYRAPEGIEVYGYYADYDWVLLCSLFGRMIDLPKGFPMYCRDLKQMLDDCYIYLDNKYHDETRLQSWLIEVKNHPDYPIQKNEHNAVADAKWNKDLYDFIEQKKFLIKERSQPQKQK